MAEILKRLEVGWGKVEYKLQSGNISVMCKDRKEINMGGQ